MVMKSLQRTAAGFSGSVSQQESELLAARKGKKMKTTEYVLQTFFYVEAACN